MHAGQPAHFTSNGTNLTEATPIRTAPLVENVISKDGFLQVVEDQLSRLPALGLIFRIRFNNLFLQRINGCVARALFLRTRVKCCAQILAVTLRDLTDHLFIKRFHRDFAFLNLERFVKLFLPPTETIDLFVGKHQGLDHNVLGDFVRACFNHNYGFSAPRHNQIQSRLAHVIVGGIDDVSTLYKADAHARNRIKEWDVRKVESARGTRYCNYVWIVIRIRGDDACYDLRFIPEALSK